MEVDTGEGSKRALTRSTADYIIKAHGFAASGAVFAASMQDGGAYSSQGLDAVGFYQQLGWAAFGRIHPAVRYGFINYRGPLDADQHELTSGIALYQSGHDLKLNTEASAFFTEGNTSPTYQVRTQLQLVF